MSSLADQLQAFEEAPRPLSDEERRLLKRMFSDYFEVPSEWKAELKADLERDPPILGKVTLGSSGSGAKLPPESLAGGGMFGDSGVGYAKYSLMFANNQPSVRGDINTYGTNSLQLWADEVRWGKDFQDAILKRISPGHAGILVDNFHFGAAGDVMFTRQGAEELSLWTHRLSLQKYNASQTETPLAVNVGGVLRQIKVGPNNSAFGNSRVLYMDNG